MKLIIGLGNPGKEYVGTRHNIGWEIVHALATSLNATFSTKKEFKAEVAETRLEGEKVILALPLTFMNLSGQAVSALMQFYKIPLENILVVHDEMDYAPGKFAFLAQGGPAGHNGVTSIQDTLGTDKVTRLRVGIGRPTSPMTKENYVLERFNEAEREILKPVIEKNTQAIKMWIGTSLDKVMNAWNGV